MSANLKIRKANEGDIPFILACEASPAGAFVQADSETIHRKNLADPTFNYLIAADHDGERLGYAMLVASGDKRKEWRRIIITKPGNGIGQAFMRSVIEKTFMDDTDTIWLDVFEDNARARHLYGKLGFIETSSAPAPETPERNLVVMELTRPE